VETGGKQVPAREGCTGHWLIIVLALGTPVLRILLMLDESVNLYCMETPSIDAARPFGFQVMGPRATFSS